MTSDGLLVACLEKLDKNEMQAVSRINFNRTNSAENKSLSYTIAQENVKCESQCNFTFDECHQLPNG